MKKNLLFVIPSLAAGGGEKSLVNLLNQIDYNQFNVDLFLFRHNGLFMDAVPDEVRILPIPETFQVFTLPLLGALMGLLLKGQLSIAINRFMFTLKNRLTKNTPRREQLNWKHVVKSLEQIENKYDVAIGFLEKSSTYLCVDKVNADKKIGWIHIDYDKLGMDPEIDFEYFDKLNHIVTVSEECANILKMRFPSQKHKVDVIYNIVSPKFIHQMSSKGNKNIYHRTGEEIILLSIGRLHYQKGFEMAIEACNKLLERGHNIKWNIIGDGDERENLIKLIKFYNLQNHFELLGLKSNPYPYIKQADIYVQTSKFEGKSIAIDEAKILQKPIVVTNFSTAKDQINDGIDGLVVNMNPDAIADGVEKLIQDKSLKERLVFNLSQLNLGTEKEINKLYQMLN